MEFSEVFKVAAQAIFTAFGDIASAATYTSVGLKNYNTTTGATTSTDVTYAVDMIFDEFSSFDIDNQSILRTDKKAMIPVDNLTPTPVIRRDTITKDGVKWEIIGRIDDPADALYIFHIRMP